MLKKLNIYGVRGIALQWFKSYLGSRKQCTVVNNSVSSFSSLTHGVPQGSILGPILFLLYINDIARTSNKLNFLLFADDTTIYIQGNNLHEIQNTLNSEMLKVLNWIKSNKLTINVSKTQYMISSSLLHQSPPIEIYLDNILLKQVEQCKFLGVTIDSKLRWSGHVNETCTRLSKIIGILYKIRRSLTVDCIRQIYLALAYPHLTYCCAIWGGTVNTNLQALFIIKKKLLRVMSSSGRYAHTQPLFENFKLLKLYDIITLQTCNFIYKSIHNFQVDCGFQLMPNTYNSRRTSNFILPLYRTSHAQRYVTYRGVKQWNQLPEEVKDSPSYNEFKNKLKKIYLEITL